eukprot:TRINITY_DN71184_c0_g1_i1.p1 TRINITY_DN71184_c0_g1~~TRINITY_DN71184_c0_g1_i1.p1  ORF type:complete len:295 (+),score=-16.56 TRINITY_DN71184_c0_g1_i1:404-1288(+)
MYLIQKWMSPTNESVEPIRNHKLFFFLLALLDFIGFVLGLIGLTMVATSVYQIMFSGSLIGVFLLSKFCLSRTYSLRHYIAILAIICGLILVGVASIIWSKVIIKSKITSQETGTPTTFTGVILMLSANIFRSLQIVGVEKIFSTYKYDPLLTGGIFYNIGFVICVICLIIFNNIPCSPIKDGNGDVKFCHFGVVEDAILGFKQIGDNQKLAILVGIYFPIVAGLRYCMFTIQKHWSSVVLAIMSCARAISLWGVSLILLWEDFNWLQVRYFLIKHVVIWIHFSTGRHYNLQER